MEDFNIIKSRIIDNINLDADTLWDLKYVLKEALRQVQLAYDEANK